MQQLSILSVKETLDTAAGFGLGYSPTRELFVQLFAEL